MNVLGAISRLNKLTLNKTTFLSRNITLNSALPFRSTPILLAEPLKKKKRLDPAVIRQREERKKRKIEKQIRRLEKNARQLKPIEECEIPLEVFEKRENLERKLPKISEEIMEKRELLHKKWCNYKLNEHLKDVRMLDKIVYSQQKALDELRKESEELYQEAIQFDFNLIPFNCEGPVETPPIKNYEVPDGDYQDISKVW